MTRIQAETLRELAIRSLNAALDGSEDWSRPLDIGGGGNSHHTTTLAKMLPFGWVERRNTGFGQTRPAWRYRITAKGREALANHRASVELARQAVIAAGERAKARG